MKKEDFEKRIEEAEQIREKGRTEEAYALFKEILFDAFACGEHALAASACAHRLICYKHWYQNTGNDGYLAVMQKEIAIALDYFQIPESEKAVFHLRLGDVYFLRGKFQDAYDKYLTAYRLIPKTDSRQHEYAGHVAESLTQLGRVEIAISILLTAIEEINDSSDLRAFHRKVILSGLYARLFRAALKSRRLLLAASSFAHGYELAWELALNDRYPQRRNQYNQAIKAHAPW
jgi:tetratricopeptide (TPR) repeat protein